MHALLYGGSERPNLSETEHGIPQRSKALPNYIRSYGAHKIATSLRQNGWDVEVLDFLPGWSLDQLKEYTVKRITKKTKFIGFSLTFRPQSKEYVKQMNDLIAWVREEYPSVKVLAGSQSYFAITDINADYHLVGWAENAVEKKNIVFKFFRLDEKNIV